MLWANPWTYLGIYVELCFTLSGYIYRVIDRVRVSVCVCAYGTYDDVCMVYAGEEKRGKVKKMSSSVGLDSSLASPGRSSMQAMHDTFLSIYVHPLPLFFLSACFFDR